MSRTSKAAVSMKLTVNYKAVRVACYMLLWTVLVQPCPVTIRIVASPRWTFVHFPSALRLMCFGRLGHLVDVRRFVLFLILLANGVPPLRSARTYLLCLACGISSRFSVADPVKVINLGNGLTRSRKGGRSRRLSARGNDGEQV